MEPLEGLDIELKALRDLLHKEVLADRFHD